MPPAARRVCAAPSLGHDRSRHPGADAIGAAELSPIAALAGRARHHACWRRRRPSRPTGLPPRRARATASPSSARAPASTTPSSPPISTRERVRLVAMDMDSTLITIECIDEIADMLGIKPQVAAITAARCAARSTFAKASRSASRCWRDCRSTALERVYDERLQLSPGAERMIAGFAAVGAKTLLVSGGFTFFTDRLQARLGLDSAAVEHAGDRRRPTDRPRDRADRRRAGEGGAARGRCSGARARTAGSRSRSATARTTCRCCAPPTSRSPITRSRSCAREATYAIDHCGLDAVLNLFA